MDEKATEDGSDGAFVVTGAKFAGISGFAYEKRFHADGTVEEEPVLDIMAEMPPEGAAVLGVIMEIAEAAQNGEEVDIDKLFDTLGEQFPEKKEEFEASREMIRNMDPEQLRTMFSVGE